VERERASPVWEQLAQQERRHKTEVAALKAAAARQAQALERDVALHRARAQELGERCLAVERRERVALERCAHAEAEMERLLGPAKANGRLLHAAFATG
jgi:hypothetical protein